VATGLSMMAGASDQKAINTTRKPAILNDANVGNCPSMRNRRTRVSTTFASAAPSATVRRKTATSTRTLTLVSIGADARKTSAIGEDFSWGDGSDAP